jgi:hypothetical protein
VALPTRRPDRRSLTASAVKLGKRESQYSKRLAQGWQMRALEYYDRIGELRFTSHFLARQMSRVRFFPARLKEDGTIEPIISGAPVEVLNRIQDPGGGRSRIQFDYGRMMFITGEGVLFGSRLDSDQEGWKFLWREEVKIEGTVAIRKDAQGKETDERGVAYRMWTPHPRHSDEADSPMRAVLDIAEELLILTASVRSTAVSRMTNGMLLLPTEISPNPMLDALGQPLGDEDPESNILLQDYMEHVTSQIENPGTPEASMAFTLEAAYEYLDRVRWMQTHDPQNDYLERELRVECIKRLALGLDMNPEDLLGYTDANHWTAKQVQHDRWRIFGVHRAEQFADDLNQAYLRPALEDEGYEGWQDVVIGSDDSEVVISPDRTEDADKALDRMAISFKGYRELKAIPESMAPSEEEKEFLASIKMRQPIELDGDQMVMPQRGPVAQSGNGGSPEEGPRDPGTRLTSRQESRTASILGGAALALRQCRAKAGARLRSHQHSCEECKEKTDGLAHSLVASTLGVEQVHSFGVDPLKLVQGGTEEFRGLLVEQGIQPTQADALCQRLEIYAAKTLFDSQQPELPPGFMAQVAQAEEVSDAVVNPA